MSIKSELIELSQQVKRKSREQFELLNKGWRLSILSRTQENRSKVTTWSAWTLLWKWKTRIKSFFLAFESLKKSIKIKLCQQQRMKWNICSSFIALHLHWTSRQVWIPYSSIRIVLKKCDDGIQTSIHNVYTRRGRERERERERERKIDKSISKKCKG